MTRHGDLEVPHGHAESTAHHAHAAQAQEEPDPEERDGEVGQAHAQGQATSGHHQQNAQTEQYALGERHLRRPPHLQGTGPTDCLAVTVASAPQQLPVCRREEGVGVTSTAAAASKMGICA